MPCNPQNVIRTAESQKGYLEKKSNSELDSFTGNAGSNNYTKYNRDMKAWAGSANLNDQWCQNFVDWCFVKAYGLEAAKALLRGFTNYTPTGSNHFKKRGLYIERGKGKPQPGDVIYFYSSAKGRIGHVGIVKSVTSSKVYTIEGNTSGASTLVTNGGGVREKSYSLKSTYIDGYGRPPYASVTASGSAPAQSAEKVYALGDRILENGMVGPDVKQMQAGLLALGYDLGEYGADGDFGSDTEDAVKNFQKEHGLDADGEFGPLSLAAMNAALKKLAEPAPAVLGNQVLKNGMSGADVKQMQENLIRLGYDLGKWGADGDFGDATELAVRRFQTQEDLTPDGEFGPLSLAAMEKALAKLNAPAEQAAMVQICGGNCYVRSTPAVEKGNIRGVAHEGTKYPFTGVRSIDGWLQIVYKDKAGWVSGKYGRLRK